MNEISLDSLKELKENLSLNIEKDTWEFDPDNLETNFLNIDHSLHEKAREVGTAFWFIKKIGWIKKVRILVVIYDKKLFNEAYSRTKEVYGKRYKEKKTKFDSELISARTALRFLNRMVKYDGHMFTESKIKDRAMYNQIFEHFVHILGLNIYDFDSSKKNRKKKF